MSTPRYIERPPRLQPNLPFGDHQIPDPPEEKKDISQPLIQIFLPMLTILVYFIMAILGQGRNLVFMLPMGISVVASIALALYNRYQSTRNKGNLKAAYQQKLVELRKEMTTQHDIQRRFRRHNYPAPNISIKIASDAGKVGSNGDQESELANRLWERRTSDNDFGDLRLGVGSLPSTVVYVGPQSSSTEDMQARDALRLAADSKTVTDIPITIPLRFKPKNGKDSSSAENARHAIGVVGSREGDIHEFLSAVLVNFSTYHSPNDARIYLLGLQESRNAWRWLGRLPHCSSERPQEVLCFEEKSDREGEKEKNKVSHFLRGIRAILDERKMRLQDSDNNQDVTLPFLLVVVDLSTPIPEDSMLADLESDPAITMLLNEGPQLGAAIFFLVSENGQVPSNCQSVIELIRSDTINSNDVLRDLSFRYAEVGVNTPRYAGQADTIIDVDALLQFSQNLEPLMVRKSYGADLPRGVLMLDMLGIKTADELRDRILTNWQTCQIPDKADWLKVSLGMLSGGETRHLKFSADADGVHGLIAGSTGSGKSELLMTMILGLAYNFDPSIVNFVLVDFKGGAAFEPFRKLPHVVDIVTNLKGSAVERMFAAIMAEIHRREAINVATESKHIVHYRKNGLHVPPYGNPIEIKGETYKTAPYPHLFVFIDEFAEMIAENPEYKAQLNSITRLGRALGITLILAAQRPTGVTDQMRANIKFRIALRVETREESSEVLRRPDAAYLPTGIPGRGYLQVGNENVELIQIAWTGSEYRGGLIEEKPRVIWHERPQKSSGDGDRDEFPKVYEMVVDLMTDLAREHSLPQRKPWPDFLPETFSLQTPIDSSYINPEGLNFLLTETTKPVIETASPENEPPMDTIDAPLTLNGAITPWVEGNGYWPGIDWDTQAMRAVIGLIDNPYHSEQLPAVVDLRRGHAVIFGASGWGKTTFLRTLITTLVARHSPEELHVYILDFGGRQLSLFRDLPHLGAIITPDEEERVVRLIRLIDTILENRKSMLSDAGADDIYSYNASHPNITMPAILVAIDNFAEFREGFDHLMPTLVSLVREARAYGIHFAVSAQLPGSLSGKLYSLFTERLTLKLSDPTEYTAIVGRGARGIDDIPGRGFVKVGRRALEYQVALPVGATGDAQDLDETQKLALLVRSFRDAEFDYSDNRKPQKIQTLANRILLTNLLASLDAQVSKSTRIQPVLGIEDLNLEPWHFDLAGQGPHCFIIGPPNSGKTTTLRSLVLSLASSYRPDQVMLVLADVQRRLFRYGGQASLEDLPHVVEAIDNGEAFEEFVENLRFEFEKNDTNKADRPHIFVIIDNYDSFSDEARSFGKVLIELAVLAREHGTDGLHFVLAGSPNITRSAEELRKQVQLPRFGIALQTADTVQMLNGRVPRSLAQAELPPGRGFVVRAGRTLMLQIATPYEDIDYQESILDGWVEKINELYPEKKAVWSRPLEPDEEEQDNSGSYNASDSTPSDATQLEESQEGQANADVDSDESSNYVLSIPKGIKVEELKKQLLDEGLESDLIDLLSEVDVVNIALEMEILTEDELK